MSSVISPNVVVPSDETTKGCAFSSRSFLSSSSVLRSSSAFLSASTRASSSAFSAAILSASFFSASMRVFSSASARSRSSAAFLSASAFSVAMRSASALAASSLRYFSPTMAFQASPVLCASATAASFSLIDCNNSSGVSPFSFSAFAAFNLFSAPRKNTNAKGST